MALRYGRPYRSVALIALLVLVLIMAWMGFFNMLVIAFKAYNTSFVKVEAERTKLISGIESYQSVEEFKSFLSKRSMKWRVTEDYRPDFQGARPPFNGYEITITNYVHHGYSGELIVNFFNDRLESTSFYPQEYERYLEALKKVEGIHFDEKGEAKIPPYTGVWFGVRGNGRKYVEWYDDRLKEEILLWTGWYT